MTRAFTMDELGQYWDKVVAVLAAVLTVLFGSKLTADWFKDRRDGKRERQKEAIAVHVTNEKAEIDADVKAMGHFYDRLTTCEGRIDALQEQLRKESVANAKLSVENEHLRGENLRLAGELERINVELTRRDDQIISFKHTLELKERDFHTLQMELRSMQSDIHVLENKVLFYENNRQPNAAAIEGKAE